MNHSHFAHLTSSIRSSKVARKFRRQAPLARATAQVAVGVLALASAAIPTMASNLYWDINGTTAGAGSATPTGTWSSAFWSTDSTGSSATAAWIDGNTPVFSAGTNATGAFTVTLTAIQTINGATVEEGTVNVTGSTLALSGGALSMATTTTFASVITNTGAFTSTIVKTGAGGLTLSAVNTFSNDIEISAGAITILTNAGAAGTSTNAIQVDPNATLSINTVGTFARAVTLGSSGSPAFNNSGGTDTATGIITLTNTSTAINQSVIGVSSGTLNLNTTDQLQGSGGSNFAGSITKNGSGTLNINAAQTKLTGPLYMSNFIMNIGGAAGALPNIGDMSIGLGNATTTTINNSTANIANRFNDNSQIIFTAGAELSITGATGWATNELVGNLVASNNSTLNTATNVGNTSNDNLTLNGGSGGTTFSAASIIVQTGAMLNIRGPAIGTSAANMLVVRDSGASLMIRGTTGGTGTSKPIINGILGDTSVSGSGTDFVAWNSTSSSLVPLVTADYATTGISGDINNQNFSISAAEPAVATDTTINSLKTTGTASITINSGKTLTIGSGMVLFTVGTNVSGGFLNVPTNTELLTVVRANSNISSVIEGASTFVKAGAGTLTLSGHNTYTAPTIVSSGTMAITTADALGDVSGGTNVYQGASLQVAGTGLSIAEPITINGLQTGTIRGAVANIATNDGFGMDTAFVGGLDNPTGSNTITGSITLAGIQGNIGQPGLNTISVGTYTGSAATPPNSQVQSGTLTVSSNMTIGAGTTSLSKTGPGTLILQGSNAYTTLTRLWGGTLVAEADGAVGSESSGNLGVVQLQGNYSTFALEAPPASSGFTYNGIGYNLSGYALTLTGWGQGNLGTLDNLGGDNTFAGAISLGGPSTLSTGTGDLAQDYLGVQSGSLTLTSSVGTGGERAFTKIGPGNLIFGNTMNLVGPFEVRQGTVTFKGFSSSAFGNFGSATPVITWLNVNSGTSVVFDNSLYNYASQAFGGSPMNLTVPLNLFGGELKIIGNAGNDGGSGNGQTVYEDFTQPNLFGVLHAFGMSTFTVAADGFATGVTTPARVSRDTFFIRGMGDGLGEAVIGGSPASVGAGSADSTNVGILPFVIGDSLSSGLGSDFVTYDTSLNSYRVLNSDGFTGENTALVDADTTVQNTFVSGGTTNINSVSPITSINSLKLTSGSTVAIGSGVTLSMSAGAGAILATGASASQITGGTIAFGTTEGFITSAIGTNLAISSSITGSAGLTISGGSAVTDNTGALVTAGSTVTLSGNNTFTGGLQLNGGTLIVSNDNNLGSTGVGIALAGGIFQPASSFTTTSRGISLIGRGNIDVEGSQTFTVTGNITSPTAGDISGTLTKTGAGTLVLKGTNTYTGGTTILGGILSVGSSASLAKGSASGFSPITIDGGTLQFTGGNTYSIGGGIGIGIQLGKGNGTIDVEGAATRVQWGDATSPMYGPGALIKTGPGTWEFLSDSPNYAGGTYINGGTLQIDVGDTIPTASSTSEFPFVQINNTGRFLLNNVTMSNADIYIGNGGTLAGAGASAQFSKAFGVQIAGGTSATLQAPASADVLTIGSAMGNYDLSGLATTSPPPTINIAGAGVVFLSATQSTSFFANYLVDNGATLRIGDSVTPLGNSADILTIGTGGGTIQARVSAGRINSDPVVINGTTTFNEQSTTANGGGSFQQTYSTLRINGDQSISVTHNPAGTGLFGVISGGAGGAVFSGAVTLNGSPTFNISNPSGAPASVGVITFNGPISETGGSRSITGTGAGRLTLSSGTITGTINDQIGGGNGGVLGGITVTSTFTAGRVLESGAGTLTINGAAAKLTLAAGNPTSDLNAVPTFTGAAAELDVTNNKVVIDYTGSTVAPALLSALSGGAHFTGNIPAWNGKGIVSATAKTNDVTNANNTTAIGYAEASDLGLTTFGTVTGIDTTALLLKYTYYGDLNLDGKIDADDYALIDRQVALHGLGASGFWFNGDVNYDGVVNANDYLLMDATFINQGFGVLSPGFLAERQAEFGSDYVNQLVAAVPEPTSAALIGLASLGILGKRRRRA